MALAHRAQQRPSAALNAASLLRAMAPVCFSQWCLPTAPNGARLLSSMALARCAQGACPPRPKALAHCAQQRPPATLHGARLPRSTAPTCRAPRCLSAVLHSTRPASPARCTQQRTPAAFNGAHPPCSTTPPAAHNGARPVHPMVLAHRAQRRLLVAPLVCNSARSTPTTPIAHCSFPHATTYFIVLFIRLTHCCSAALPLSCTRHPFLFIKHSLC
jgi:hypothetical protein